MLQPWKKRQIAFHDICQAYKRTMAEMSAIIETPEFQEQLRFEKETGIPQQVSVRFLTLMRDTDRLFMLLKEASDEDREAGDGLKVVK